jgi:hypothetical protein
MHPNALCLNASKSSSFFMVSWFDYIANVEILSVLKK